MKEYIAKVFSEEKYSLGESPFYDYRTKTVSWVDISEGKFYAAGDDGKGEIKSYDFRQAIGAAVPAEKAGSYVVAGTDGLYLLEGGKSRLIKELTEFYESYQRSNDAKADAAGRLWFGSSVDDGVHEASGNLFCIDSADGGKVEVREPNTTISNGMAWSRDHKKFYFSDTLQYAVFEYDYDLESGMISNRKVLFKTEKGCGFTDGMCIDADDNLWVAFWEGSRIEQRSTKNGSVLATVKVDALNVTSCCFIGDKLDTLFITTSGRGLNGKYDGCLFTCKVEAVGVKCDFCKV